jgi:uncharacterized repeat protein (TIGR01451 family)
MDNYQRILITVHFLLEVQGQNLTYTVTVRNNGPADAPGVTLADILPTTANFVSATSSQGTCTGTATVNCQLGSLANQTSATVTIVVVPTLAGSISNMVTVGGSVNDPNQANNVTVESTTVRLILIP